MKALKKTLSLVLAVCLVASMACVAAVSVSANADDQLHRPLITDVVNSGDKVDTNTYMFYLPETWKNEYNDYYNVVDNHFAAGIYWWEGPYNCNDNKGDLEQGWPGYAVTETVDGNSNIYKAEVPKEAGKFIWNNLVDGGMDKEQPFYSKAWQTMDIGNEYYDPGEDGYGFYPDGIPEGFNNMIFVCNPKATEENPLTHRLTFKGVWFYYYGNGEYGIEKTREEAAAKNAIYKDGEFPPYGFDVNPKDIEIKVGDTDKITPNDSNAKAVVADPTIASIEQAENGTVTVKGLKAGTTKVTFTLDKDGEVETAETTVTVKAPAPAKKNNTLTAKGVNKTFKAKALKKKAQSYKAVKVSKAQGKVTYKVTKKNSKLTFKNGKVTVKKKTKKGTYKMTVAVTAAGNNAYKSKTVKVNIKVTVKK